MYDETGMCPGQYPYQSQYPDPYQGQYQDPYQSPYLQGTDFNNQLPRLTKGQAYEFIRMCVQDAMRVQVSEMVKIDCNEQGIRHICLNAQDIMLLQKTSVGVPIKGTVVQVPVWVCPLCGKLYLNPDYLSYSNDGY